MKASEKIMGETAKGSQQGLSVIECLGASSKITGEVALMIVGSLSKAIEPVQQIAVSPHGDFQCCRSVVSFIVSFSCAEKQSIQTAA